MAVGRRPTTDSGTVVFHMLLAGTFLALFVTGLRIATDDPALSWVASLDPVLPMEQPWFWHLAAALVFTASLAGYVTYVVTARLTARTRLDAARLSALRRPGRPRWAACSSLIFWGLMTCLGVEIVTGAMLFAGADRAYVVVHAWATWAATALVFLHVACHAAIGGLGQLSRILRPAPLVMAPPPPDLAELLADQLSLRAASATTAQEHEPRPRPQPPPQTQVPREQPRTVRLTGSRTTLNAHPATTGLAVAAAVSITAMGVEQASRPVLRVLEITEAEAPQLDGDLSDRVWSRAPVATVMTSQGGDFGGTGQSLVEIRAVHDGMFAYFAIVWTDPTRSLIHEPLIKTADGWKIATKPGVVGEEAQFQEDKFAILLSRSTTPLIGAAIHLASAPLKGKPPSGAGRGLHYTLDGSIADVWVWRASHGGLDGHIDNAHFGAPGDPTPEQTAGLVRYTGGFSLDPGPPAYRSNAVVRTRDTGESEVSPLRLPRDSAATSRALGRAGISPGDSDSEVARWWMPDSQSVPYSKAVDDKLPVGTLIPGIVVPEPAEGSRDSIRGVARWAAGRWTLEIARRLNTASRYDVAIKTGTLMWVAAFDHSQSRHTRHLRPFRLEVE